MVKKIAIGLSAAAAAVALPLFAFASDMGDAISAARASSTKEFTDILSANLGYVLVLAVGVIAFFWLWHRFRASTKGK